MQSGRSGTEGWVERAALSFVIMALSLFVFVVLSHFRPLLPRTADLVVRIATSAALLAASQIARRRDSTRKYWQALFALFVGLVSISVDYHLVLGQRIGALSGIDPDTPAGWAIDKAGGSLTVIVLVIALTLASGGDAASLHIRRGRLALGLSVGLATFALAAITAIPLAGYLFDGLDLSIAGVLPWTPWILLFVLSNAFAEELLYPIRRSSCCSLRVCCPSPWRGAGLCRRRGASGVRRCSTPAWTSPSWWVSSRDCRQREQRAQSSTRTGGARVKFTVALM